MTLTSGSGVWTEAEEAQRRSARLRADKKRSGAMSKWSAATRAKEGGRDANLARMPPVTGARVERTGASAGSMEPNCRGTECGGKREAQETTKW